MNDEYLLRNLKNAGMTPSKFLDLGANCGCVSVMVKHLWPQCACVLVEPVAGHLQVAKQSLQQFSDIEYITAFAGERDGVQDCQDWVRNCPEVESIPVMTIQDVLKRGPFDLVKIDIEECELSVLRDSTMSELGTVVIGEWHSKDCKIAAELASLGSHIIWAFPVISNGSRGLFYAYRIAE